MKVLQDFVTKLDSTERHESNFGNLCMKKGSLFQKERVSLLLNSSMGRFDPRTPPVRTPLHGTHNVCCDNMKGGPGGEVSQTLVW